MSCSAFGCTNRSTKGSDVNFFRFPLNNKHRLRQWLTNVRRKNWSPSRSSRLCSTHFEEKHFYTDCKGKRRLRETAVPTIFSYTTYYLKRRESTTSKQLKTDFSPDPSCSPPSDPAEPHEQPAHFAYFHFVLDHKTLVNTDNGDGGCTPATDSKSDIVIVNVCGNVDNDVADDVMKRTTSGDPQTIMHDHDYHDKNQQQMCVWPDHSYFVSETTTAHEHKDTTTQDQLLSESPSTLKRHENAAQHQLVCDSSTAPEHKDTTAEDQLVSLTLKRPETASQNQLVSASPSTLKLLDTAALKQLVSESLMGLKCKERVKKLQHQLVVARKKLKLRCQQIRRLRSRLLSLKTLTKALQKKLNEYDKTIAAVDSEAHCKKCKKSRSRYLS